MTQLLLELAVIVPMAAVAIILHELAHGYAALALAIFNLFPLPPLDGGRIAVGLLPLRLAKLWAGLEPYGIVFVLLLIAVPPVLRTQGIDIDPLGSVLGPAMVRLQDGIFWLAGVPNGAV
jgi:Zn-dependent protease